MDNHREYISDKKEKLDEWKDHLEYLECNSGNIQGEAKVHFVKQLNIIKNRINRFESVLGNISGKEEILTRKEIKEDLEELSEELDSQVGNARLKCSPSVPEHSRN
jgi:hypothetical protein